MCVDACHYIMSDGKDLAVSPVAKAKQIKATDAELVVASCDNCRHQLEELNQHIDLKVKVTGLSEIVSEALI